MNKLHIKTIDELQIMKKGGKILHSIKSELVGNIKAGVSAAKIDKMAENLIIASGAKPAFKMVDGYKWSTCVNVNQGVVHGIPHKEIIFKEDDVVSIDLGVYYQGFFTDTSTSVVIGDNKDYHKFLSIGEEALKNAIKTINPNRSYVYDISFAIESTLNKYNLNPILDLTGHGIGKNLHEHPYVPCYAEGKRENSAKIVPGMALAIEVMYTMGKPALVKANDGWTIETRDGKISGLFEDTVIVTDEGFQIIT